MTRVVLDSHKPAAKIEGTEAPKKHSRNQIKANREMLSAESVRERKRFPFLDLPAEIRNMIYHYALVDTEYSVRFQANISRRDGRSVVSRSYRARRGPADRDDIPGQTRGSISKPTHSYKPTKTFPQSALSVNILQVNRQIHAEAAVIFYGNNLFTFESARDLYAFLDHFQLRLPMITKLGLSHRFGHWRDYYGIPDLQTVPFGFVFPLLTQAVNLEALYLNTTVCRGLGGRGNIAADSIHKLAHGWMRAMALHKNNKLAALDVIKLPEAWSDDLEYGKWQVEKAGQEAFRNKLSALLSGE